MKKEVGRESKEGGRRKKFFFLGYILSGVWLAGWLGGSYTITCLFELEPDLVTWLVAVLVLVLVLVCKIRPMDRDASMGGHGGAWGMDMGGVGRKKLGGGPGVWVWMGGCGLGVCVANDCVASDSWDGAVRGFLLPGAGGVFFPFSFLSSSNMFF